jgi:hypothetical protein
MSHVMTFGSGAQEHAAPSGEVGPASIMPPSSPPSVVPLELLLEELPLEELPLLDAPLLDDPLLAAPLLDDGPPEELELLVVPPLEDVVPEEEPPEDPLLEDPLPPPLSPLLQETSPTVEDAPATTSTWKSFSIFMARERRPAREGREPILRAQESSTWPSPPEAQCCLMCANNPRSARH